jgi:PST family polysaccharide transporter
VILVFGLLRAKGLAVMLGPEGVGIIGVVDQLVVTLIQISAFGIPFAAMKFMSAAHSTSQEAFRDTYAAFARITAVLAVSVLVLSVAVTTIAPGLLAGFAEYQTIVLIGLFSVPAGMMTLMLAHTLAAEQRPLGAALYNLAFTGSVAVVGLIGAYLNAVAGYYVGAGLAATATVATIMIWFARTQGLSILRPGISLRAELRKSPKIISTAISAQTALVSYSVGLLIVRYPVINLLGETQTGHLQAALSLALSVGSILATMNALYLAPSLNRNEPMDRKFRKAARFANQVAMLLVLGAVPAALLAGLGLTILFTIEFVPAALTLIFCLVWQGSFQLKTVYMQLLVGVDRPVYGAVGTVVGVLVIALLVFPMVTTFGLLAAPIALIVGDVVVIAVMIVVLNRTVGMPYPWIVVLRFVWVSGVIGATGFLFSSDVVIPGLADGLARLGYLVVVVVMTWAMMPGDLSPRAIIARLRGRNAPDPQVE